MALIELTNGGTAIIDDNDAERVNAAGRWFKVQKTNVWYVRRNFSGNTCVYLHHFLLGATSEVDHANGDGLDNRRQNLRHATRAQNTQNRAMQKNNKSGFKGVHWHKRRGKWTANIRHEGKTIHLGFFDNPLDGHQAWSQKAKELWGEFAPSRIMIAASPNPRSAG